MPHSNGSLPDRIQPGVSRRSDFALVPRVTALLIIDIQAYLAPSSHHGDYFAKEAHPQAINNIQKLAQAFRVLRDDPETHGRTGCEVIWTFLQASTLDRRDISVDYKLSGPLLAGIPPSDADPASLFLPECHPDATTGKGDILLPKTSCSVFQSTNLDYLLRNLSMEQLVIVGQMTDQCVESAVRDAADLGYLVTVAEDACAAESLDAHLKGLSGIKGFCRIMETAGVLDEILEDLASELLDQPAAVEKKPAELTDAMVVQYLRDKGMESESKMLAKLLAKKGHAAAAAVDEKPGDE